jgi:hypothetical protein
VAGALERSSVEGPPLGCVDEEQSWPEDCWPRVGLAGPEWEEPWWNPTEHSFEPGWVRGFLDEPSVQLLGEAEEWGFLCLGLVLHFAETLTSLEGETKSARTAFLLGVEEGEVTPCWIGERLRDKALGSREADPWQGTWRLKSPWVFLNNDALAFDLVIRDREEASW